MVCCCWVVGKGKGRRRGSLRAGLRGQRCFPRHHAERAADRRAEGRGKSSLGGEKYPLRLVPHPLQTFCAWRGLRQRPPAPSCQKRPAAAANFAVRPAGGAAAPLCLPLPAFPFPLLCPVPPRSGCSLSRCFSSYQLLRRPSGRASRATRREVEGGLGEGRERRKMKRSPEEGVRSRSGRGESVRRVAKS